jgi:hypothetical protein
MQEKTLKSSKNGFAMLSLIFSVYFLAIGGVIYGGILLDARKSPIIFIIFKEKGMIGHCYLALI